MEQVLEPLRVGIRAGYVVDGDELDVRGLLCHGCTCIFTNLDRKVKIVEEIVLLGFLRIRRVGCFV